MSDLLSPTVEEDRAMNMVLKVISEDRLIWPRSSRLLVTVSNSASSDHWYRHSRTYLTQLSVSYAVIDINPVKKISSLLSIVLLPRCEFRSSVID
jgi:hypothetical protein